MGDKDHKESCVIVKQLKLQERLEAFYKIPIDEICIESTQEVDVGETVGNEIW